jgi:hypothetical protein
MAHININEVVQYVEQNIGTFHKKRITSLGNLKLSQILKRKNPYLFKAKNILTAQDLVKTILDAHLSSQEEGIFGEFLEGLAIFICEKTYGGRKSSTEGIDLEFNIDKTVYLVSIKSGPNWGNSGQIKRMQDNFKRAIKVLRQNKINRNIVAVNGCCYGKDNQPDKGGFFKYCGQKFWEFISGDPDLYIEIIEPLGHKAKEKNTQFTKEYSRIINNFTLEFIKQFCKNGEIKWNALVKFNSSSG